MVCGAFPPSSTTWLWYHHSRLWQDMEMESSRFVEAVGIHDLVRVNNVAVVIRAQNKGKTTLMSVNTVSRYEHIVRYIGCFYSNIETRDGDDDRDFVRCRHIILSEILQMRLCNYW